MSRDTKLDMADGIHVILPDGLQFMTSYVLYEQKDWFEDELGFLRRWLQPGQRAIDVGANYGVYTLSMARLVGGTGAIWAFEPSTGTAAYLKRSIESNGFSQVTLDPGALSNAPGTAHLTINSHSELNSLVRETSAASATEAVSVSTLDECMRRYDWRNIDFVKIDAEGEENNIIDGGREFLSQCSPLILYEVKAGHQLHLELVRKFAERGYDSYRLVPGLDLLFAFDAGDTADGYLLNLFCCKSDRAQSLAAQGKLVDAEAAAQAASGIHALIESNRSVHASRRTLASTAYGAILKDRWTALTSDADAEDVERALVCFAMSHDATLTAATRFCALQTSLELLRPICERSPQPSRLSSLARIAYEFGARVVAVGALQRIQDALRRLRHVDMSEPFLAPAGRFDSVDPKGDLDKWFLAAVLEQYERWSAFSSFFVDNGALPRLESIAALGYDDAQMKRRLQLMRMRFPGGGP